MMGGKRERRTGRELHKRWGRGVKEGPGARRKMRRDDESRSAVGGGGLAIPARLQRGSGLGN